MLVYWRVRGRWKNHHYVTVLANADYIAGDRFSAADVYVGSHIRWGMNMTGMLEKRPVFVDYWARLCGREAYLRAEELDGAISGDGES